MPLHKRLFDFRELWKLIVLTFPLYIANLTRIGMAVTDTIVAGKSSLTDLAAVSLGVAVIAPIMMSVGAIVTMVSPMVAKLRGEGREKRVGSLLHSARQLSLRLMAVETVLLLLGSCVFGVVTDDAEMAATARLYLYFVILNVPASILQRVVLGCFEGYRQTWPGMVVFLTALLINIPLNYIFVLGWGVIPPMGGAGCGLATTIVHWFIFLSLLGLLYAMPQHRRHAVQFLSLRRAYAPLCRRIFRLGFPLGVATLCEMGFFCVVMLLLAPLGKVVIGAHQIAMNISRLLFTLPLSLGVAVSIRAAYFVGGHQRHAFNAMVRTASLFTYAVITVLTLLTVLLRQEIVGIYAQSQAVADIAMALLLYCAVYQFSDGAQALFSGLLRGCHDTKIITCVNLVSYWVIGLPLACFIIRGNGLLPCSGAAGAWLSFIVVLTVIAFFLHRRFAETRRRVFEVSPSAPEICG